MAFGCNDIPRGFSKIARKLRLLSFAATSIAAFVVHLYDLFAPTLMEQTQRPYEATKGCAHDGS